MHVMVIARIWQVSSKVDADFGALCFINEIKYLTSEQKSMRLAQGKGVGLGTHRMKNPRNVET